jgi:HSP20 family protein
MTASNQTWCPAIEFNETDTDLILKAEVPGIELKDLNVHAEAESLSIAGVHPKNKQPVQKEIIPSQLHYGQLHCQISLPVPIQLEQVRAELIDGILTVTMPKKKDAFQETTLTKTVIS